MIPMRCVLLGFGSIATACATTTAPAPLPARPPSADIETPAPPPVRAASSVEVHRCPQAGNGTAALEAGRIAPGTWLEGADGRSLHWPPGGFSTVDAHAAGRAVRVLARAAKGVADVAVLAPYEGGACVVNAWGTSLPGDLELALADHWEGAGLTVLLFRLTLHAKGTAETRWVVIATDGDRAWQPVRGGPQLIAPEVRLRHQSPHLFLDAGPRNGPYVVLELTDSGYFERL